MVHFSGKFHPDRSNHLNFDPNFGMMGSNLLAGQRNTLFYFICFTKEVKEASTGKVQT